MTDSAVDQSQIDKKANRGKRAQVSYDLTIRALMSNPDGRRFVWMELSECRVFEQTFGFGDGSHASMAFAEGMRSRGLKLLASVTRLCPQQYITMTTENSGVNITEDQPDE